MLEWSGLLGSVAFPRVTSNQTETAQIRRNKIVQLFDGDYISYCQSSLAQKGKREKKSKDSERHSGPSFSDVDDVCRMIACALMRPCGIFLDILGWFIRVRIFCVDHKSIV